MKKLELKHVAPYLPYELGIEPIYRAMGSMGGFTIRKLDIDTIYRFGIEEIKPILRPLSDLTKEIEYEGKKFMPLIELAKIATLSGESNLWNLDLKNYRVVHESGSQFYFSTDKSFIYKQSDKWKDFGVASNQFELFQNLFKWHFDVFDLIQKGLAIDINTL